MQPHRYDYGKHRSEFFNIYGEPGDGRTQRLVVLYHGGFWKQQYGLDLMAPLAEDLANDGCLVFNVEYPRVGEGKNCIEMCSSVTESYNHAVSYFGRYQQRIVVGHSAGGFYALRLGSTQLHNSTMMPTKIIAQAPVVDLWTGQHVEGLSDEHDAISNFVNADIITPRDKAFYDAISPMHKTAAETKIHLIHGLDDDVVPLSHSQLFQRNNPGAVLHTHTPDGNSFDHYQVISYGAPPAESPCWQMQKKLILR